MGVDVALADGVMTGFGDTEIWVVVVNEDGTYSFQQGDQKLGMQDSFSSMSMGSVNDKWEVISVGENLYNIKNAVRGNFMEWYASKDNWSTYGSESAATDPLFQLAFYEVVDSSDTPDTPDQPDVPEIPETGDASLVVPAMIVAALSASGMALLLKKKEF
jgi:LPXTG-motif cell wall-anchored protein